MYKRRLKALHIVIVLYILLALPTVVTAKTSSDANTEKEQLEDELQDANRESENLQKGLDKTKEKIGSLTDEQNSIKEYVRKLDGQLNDAEEKISATQGNIEAKQEEIESAKEELKKAKQEEKKQYESMKKRIQYMYENTTTGYLQLLLTSDSFSQMLARAEYISAIMRYDREMLEIYQKSKEMVIEKEKVLNEEYEQLTMLKTKQEEQQQELTKLIEKKSVEITKYETEIASAQQLADEYEEDLEAQSAIISALEASVQAKKEEIKRLQEEEAKSEEADSMQMTYDGGKFTWPCPSSYIISSEYGNRLHPILGINKFHSGLDIAAPTGSPIVAAYDGTVIAASYNDTMGNYVMIDHGDGLYTVYMHASALYVSKDEKVSRGQNIAAVGSTGRSTGPHLHFGVRLNGNYVNPHNYVG